MRSNKNKKSINLKKDLSAFKHSIVQLKKKRHQSLLFRVITFASCALLLIVVYAPNFIGTQMFDMTQILLGQKYFLAFVNNDEIRPSGGFLGTYAILDTSNFPPKITKVDTNIYNLDNEFAKKAYVPMPLPMQKKLGSHKSWTLHDSNWDPEFDKSAQSMLWFYEQETCEKLDGVIQITASSIANLLKVTGSIELDDGIQLTSDNFTELLNFKIEHDYWADPRNEQINQPKNVIANSIPGVFHNLKHTSPLSLLRFVKSSMQSQEILLYSQSSWEESLINWHNWGGKLDFSGNFIYYVQANLDSKTSQSIESNIKYDASEQTIEITRLHNGTRSQYGGGDNNTYIQLLFPPGTDIESIIQSLYNSHSRERENPAPVSITRDLINNFDTIKEQNYVSYGFWTTLTADQSETISIKLKRYTDSNAKQVHFIYQPGILNSYSTN